MLVLNLNLNEELVLKDPSGEVIAKIKLVAVRGNKVRLGTTAPKDKVLIESPKYRAKNESNS